MLTRAQLRKFEEHYTIETKSEHIVEYGEVEKESEFLDPDNFYNTEFTPIITPYETEYNENVRTTYAVSPVNSQIQSDEFMSHEDLIITVEALVAKLEAKDPSPALTETQTLFALVDSNSAENPDTISAEFFAVNAENPTQVIPLTEDVANAVKAYNKTAKETNQLILPHKYHGYTETIHYPFGCGLTHYLSEVNLKAVTAHLSAPYNELSKLSVFTHKDAQTIQTPVLKAIKGESKAVFM